jgi:hypothetical protein
MDRLYLHTYVCCTWYGVHGMHAYGVDMYIHMAYKHTTYRHTADTSYTLLTQRCRPTNRDQGHDAESGRRGGNRGSRARLCSLTSSDEEVIATGPAVCQVVLPRLANKEENKPFLPGGLLEVSERCQRTYGGRAQCRC